MADRKVTATGKNEDGDITSLCDPGAYWSPRAVEEAIEDIELKIHRYYVLGSGGREVDVHVIEGPTGKYLRTDPDSSQANNLDELPDC